MFKFPQWYHLFCIIISPKIRLGIVYFVYAENKFFMPDKEKEKNLEQFFPLIFLFPGPGICPDLGASCVVLGKLCWPSDIFK